MTTPFQKLQSQVNKRQGFAHPNRFSITFPVINGVYGKDEADQFELFCEATSIPGRQMLTTDYQPTRQIEKRPNGYANEDVNFTFNLTNDYFIRDIFNRWTNLVVNRETYEVGYRRDYSIDIEIHQLNERNQKVYTVELLDAFPVTVQNIELNQGTGESVQKLDVTIAYRDFIEAPIPFEEYKPKDFVGPGGGPRTPSDPARATRIEESDEKFFKQKRRKFPRILAPFPPEVNRRLEQINNIRRIFGLDP